MTCKIKKVRQTFTPAQELEYVKSMVGKSYTVQQGMDLSFAGSTGLSRWKQQFLAKQRGEVVEGEGRA